MTGHSVGRRRKRVYQRTFDWAEVRARHAAGEGVMALARAFGVDKKSISKVIRLPQAYVDGTTPEQAAVVMHDRDKDPCPRCGRPKMKEAQLCRDCRSEVRVDEIPIRLVRVAGVARTELRNVALHRIVKVDTHWGVVCGRMSADPNADRLVDFWEGGRQWIGSRKVVTVAPSSRVFVGSTEEAEEDIL